MSEQFKKAIAILIAFLLTGCSTLDVEKVSKENLPVVRNRHKKIFSEETVFELPLIRFGRDLSLFSEKTQVLGIAPITNESPDRSIPEVFKRMMLTASVKLASSPLAEQKIHIVDLDSSTDFYSLILKLGPPPPIGIRIDGSITEGDRIVSKNINTDVETTVGRGRGESDLGASYNQGAGAEVITLDLNASVNGLLVPLGYSSSTLLTYQREKGTEFSLYNRILGLQIGGTYNLNDSKSYAIRMLIEFSLIQVLGRVFVVPYWHCYKTHNTDKALANYMLEDWESKSEKKRWEEYSKILKLYLDYYLQKKVNIDPTTVDGLRNIKALVHTLMRYYNLSNPLSFKTYFSLFNNMPFCGYPKDKNLSSILSKGLVYVKKDHSKLGLTYELRIPD